MGKWRSVGLVLLAAFTIAMMAHVHQAPDAQTATAYYVATDGDDANAGTVERPFRTIQQGVSVASAGTTVYIRGGVYQESVTIEQSGTASAPITIMAYPGETPVVDGDDYTLPTIEWDPLFSIEGDYVRVSGLEVRYSKWMGLVISGRHSAVSQINSHHHKENGILVQGDHSVVENSRVWWNCTSNEYGITTRDTWASGLSAARHPIGAVLRGNVVYNNWGEGLSTYEASGTVLEDNIVYDNHTNVYISDATDVVLQRNLIYSTPESLTDIPSDSNSRVGIMLGDERYNPPSRDIVIVNNVVSGNRQNIYWWQGTQGGGMKRVLIAYNTLVNAYGDAGLQINDGPHQNVRVMNNIVYQDNGVRLADVPASSELTFSNNLWSRRPPASVAGSGDVIGNPQLIETGSAEPGGMTADWFRILSSSPARARAKVLGSVTDDFFRTQRGSAPTIGAYEYGDAPPLPSPPPPTDDPEELAHIVSPATPTALPDRITNSGQARPGHR